MTMLFSRLLAKRRAGPAANAAAGLAATDYAERANQLVEFLTDLNFVQAHTNESTARVGNALGSLRDNTNALSNTLNRVVDEVGSDDGSGHSLRAQLDRAHEDAQQLTKTMSRTVTDQLKLTTDAGHLIHQMDDGADRTERAVQSTRIVAMNTKIEGHRLGAAGRAVMVLADHVVSVSKDVAEINQIVTTLASQLSIILPKISASTSAMSDHLSTSMANIDKILSELVERQEELQNKVKANAIDSAQQADGIHEALADVVIQLQFSDRVSQVVERVKLGLVEMLAEIDADTAETWRSTLGAQSLSAALTLNDPDALESGELNFL